MLSGYDLVIGSHRDILTVNATYAGWRRLLKTVYRYEAVKKYLRLGRKCSVTFCRYNQSTCLFRTILTMGTV
jgi:hypothetical protein